MFLGLRLSKFSTRMDDIFAQTCTLPWVINKLFWSMCLQLSCAESHGGTQCTTLLCSEQQDSGATVPDRCACRLQLSWAVLISGALYPGLLTSCFDRCAYSSAGLKATGERIVPLNCAVNSKFLDFFYQVSCGWYCSWLAVGVRTLRSTRFRRQAKWWIGFGALLGVADCPTLDREWWNQRPNRPTNACGLHVSNTSSARPLIFQCTLACEVFLKNVA